MAFRNLLDGIQKIDTEVSAIHGIFDYSTKEKHPPLLFTNIAEAPGHHSALNVLTRQRICDVFDVSAGELIDILAWAMNNPSDPEIIRADNAPVLENTFNEVNLLKIPIPWHYREDRGRYQSASVIIAEYKGIRNMSYHRQFLRDENHCVSRFVPWHF